MLLSVLLLFAGCGNIRVIEAPRPAARPTAGLPRVSDLAITSVDFDPALQGNQLIFSEEYMVLAAVENRGQRLEHNIVITAQLIEQSSATIVFSKTASIAELAPGAVTVVELGPEAIPRGAGPNLRLVVKGALSSSDNDLTNNQRDFLIHIAP